MASSAVAGVVSSADFAGFVDSCGTFETEYGDGILAPGVCDGICGDFAEVAPLAKHGRGATVDAVPPVVRDTAIAGMSHAEQCWNVDESLERVRLLPTDKDMSTAEPEAIVVGAVGTGAPWFLTGWAEGTEVEFMINTGCQVTILATSVF